MKLGSDRGYATITMAIILLAVVAMVAATAIWIRVHVAGHRAQVAADLGAVSAARATSCQAGEKTVRANGAEMASCGLFESDAVVSAVVSAGMIRVQRVARAGPIEEFTP